MESNSRSKLAKFFENKKLTAVFSVLLAIVIWLTVSINQSPVVERVVKDVPVVIDDSVPGQLGYEAFGADGLTVDVTVSGRRYQVGDNVLTNKDITVTAVTTYVDSPGNYSLQLRAVANDANAEYTIVDKSTDYVEVYFDTPKTVDVNIEAQLETSDELVSDEDYMTTDPILSAETVTVTGPASQVDKISKAVAVAEAGSNLKKSETYDAKLQIVDENGSELKYLSYDLENLTITVPVYRITELPLSVTFSNAPNSYYVDHPPTYTISPSTVKIGLEADKYKELTSVSLGEIDFNDLKDGTNTFTFQTSDIVDGVSLEEDVTYTVVVEADLSHVDSTSTDAE